MLLLLNNQCITEEIKEETKKYLETNENPMILNLWDATKAVLREETRKISNKQPNLTPQATRERSINQIQS